MNDSPPELRPPERRHGAENRSGGGQGMPAEAPLRQALCRVMSEIHRRGWCDGTGGNFSCVLLREPTRLLMAPSGVDKGRVRPGDLLLVDGEGTVLQGGGAASAETRLHLTIIESCRAGAVLHTHSQAATLLSGLFGPPSGSAAAGAVVLKDLEMLKGLQGISSHAETVRLPVLANDQNLTRLSARARPLLPDAPWGLLIAGHGLYAWGEDLAMARRHLEIHEFLLEQQWRQLMLELLVRSAGPTG